jgi:OPA family glycerol-3-phosphate transporter-like MFS transporter
MTKLGAGLGVGPAELGLIGSLYFISYACGQLVNGFIGDKVVPEKFICLAVTGTALINFIISLSGSYWVVLALWCLNGCFQSMFWGPLMRMLSQRFPPESKNAVSTGMSCSMMVGYILSWSVLGKLLLNSSWTSYFLVPSLISGAILVAWLIYIFFQKVHLKLEKP